MTMTHTYTETGVRTTWVRLELIDNISNNAKYYVIWDSPETTGYLGAFGRIGGRPQWTADSKRSATQYDAKTSKGYRKVSEGEVLIPNNWMQAFHTGSSDATTASLRKGIWDATFSATVAIDQERPLSDLLEKCQKLVSESVANPDAAMHTFAEVIGRVEAARLDCDDIESLIETIQLLLGKGES